MSDIDITKQDMSYVELMAGVDKTELKRRASSEKNVDKAAVTAIKSPPV